jgi:predicted nucleic acid-binding protein
MKILFDTNIILDELLERTPFYKHADQLFAAVERQQLVGLLAATTVTTIYNLTARVVGTDTAQHAVSRLLLLFEIAPVSYPVLASALSLPFRDYEDAVIHEAARLAGVDGIVTRDGADFRGASLPVYTPEALLILLKARS